MTQRPYQEFSERDLILRDHLALDRTALANERTLLAYIRTALAFLLTGIGLVKFFQEIIIEIFGLFFIFCSISALSIGMFRYRAYHKHFKRNYR